MKIKHSVWKLSVHQRPIFKQHYYYYYYYHYIYGLNKIKDYSTFNVSNASRLNPSASVTLMQTASSDIWTISVNILSRVRVAISTGVWIGYWIYCPT
jgi:hypothetical protein